MTRKIMIAMAMVFGLMSIETQAAEHYVIDTKGMHAFVSFRVQHLGFSWIQGRFNRFAGEFYYDENNPAENRVDVEIDVDSLDTNHAERDLHLRSERFFDADKFPKARFVSTGYEDQGNGAALLKGKFTLRGITKDIEIQVKQVGGGKDPWGGFRRGFEGTTTLHLSDYQMKEAESLTPAAENIQVWLSVEGVRQ